MIMNMKRTLLAASVALVLTLTGCSMTDEAASETTPPAEPTLTETHSPTPTVDERGTKDSPHELGAFGASDDGSMWDVTIRDTMIDGTADVVASNPYNEPTEGWQYVTGTISSVVREDASADSLGQSLTPMSVMPVFVGGDGKIYDIWRADNSAPVLDGDWLDQPDIVATPGIESTGIFAIEVPTEAVPGGQFAVQNQQSGNLVYFGPVVE